MMKMPVLGQCGPEHTRIRARGEPYFTQTDMYNVELFQCVPYTRERVEECIPLMDQWKAGPLRITEFLWAMRNAVIGVGAANGIIIDPETITVEVVE